MFKLKRAELNRAKRAVEHHGYSTLLPMPVEWESLHSHWPDIQAELCNIDLEHYEPKHPLAITVAKNEKNTRILHLLHPEDMLIYTSMVLAIKNDIEAARLPRADQRVYSYRASHHKDQIYNTTQHVYKNYIGQLRHKARKVGTKYVGITDISNFYSSISQKKLEQLLLAAVRTPRRRKIASLLTSMFLPKIMPHEGRGIPTGPFASRLLAEALIDDIDRQLSGKSVDFVRWVDDFNFFTKSFVSAQRTIFELSKWLYEEHELTLHPAKTRILKVEDYSKTLLSDPEDRLYDKGEVISLLLAAYDQDLHEHEAEDLDEIMDHLNSIELLEMLVDAIVRNEGVDYRKVDFASRRLSWVSLDPKVAEMIVEILVENMESLSPVVENVAKLITALVPISAQQDRRVARRLLRSASKIDFIDHHAVWILTIFAQDERWGCKDQLIELFERGESDAVKRYAALAAARVAPGDLLLSKADFDQAVPMVRLAMLRAWASVPHHKRSPRRIGHLHGKLEEAVAGCLE